MRGWVAGARCATPRLRPGARTNLHAAAGQGGTSAARHAQALANPDCEAGLKDGTGRARLFLDPARSPVLVRDFKRVKWQGDDLDKSDPLLTHASDALGYMVHAAYPVVTPPPTVRGVDGERPAAKAAQEFKEDMRRRFGADPHRPNPKWGNPR